METTTRMGSMGDYRVDIGVGRSRELSKSGPCPGPS